MHAENVNNAFRNMYYICMESVLYMQVICPMHVRNGGLPLSKRNIYTPEGVQDILVEECYTKRGIEDSIRKVFRGFGYFEIETPSLEFYDTFSADGDLIPQEAMFKFFDQQGRILVLRPDITIPVARIVATKYKNTDYHLKFSYIGNTFRYNELGGGKQKEFTQAGLELIGVYSP